MTSQAPWSKKLLYDIQQKWGTCDFYRDTPIRFLGYANEVGEACRMWVPVSAVRATYVVASAYVLADSLDKSHKAYKKVYLDHHERQKCVAIALLDTLAWQAFASVMIPGFTINRLCAASNYLLSRFTQLSRPPIKLATTAIGLAAIPFIVKPIDTCVDVVMDRWARPHYLSSPKELKQICEKT